MGGQRTRFGVNPDGSAVLIEARSNVGPIEFGSMNIDGYVEVATDEDHEVLTDPAPAARVIIGLNSLRSGNSLYDAELLRRVDARQYPTAVLELQEARRLSRSDRYEVTGSLTFHGVRRTLEGTVQVTRPDDKIIRIDGEHALDIRDFNIAAPNVLMLRIYPDVRVHLQLEAQLVALSE